MVTLESPSIKTTVVVVLLLTRPAAVTSPIKDKIISSLMNFEAQTHGLGFCLYFQKNLTKSPQEGTPYLTQKLGST